MSDSDRRKMVYAGLWRRFGRLISEHGIDTDQIADELMGERQDFYVKKVTEAVNGLDVRSSLLAHMAVMAVVLGQAQARGMGRDDRIEMLEDYVIGAQCVLLAQCRILECMSEVTVKSYGVTYGSNPWFEMPLAMLGHPNMAVQNEMAVQKVVRVYDGLTLLESVCVLFASLAALGSIGAELAAGIAESVQVQPALKPRVAEA